MHFEILVEDQSGKKALKILVPKIVGEGHQVNIRHYKGIGRIPKNGKPLKIRHEKLLCDLPLMLRAYGKTYGHQWKTYPVAVIVVCDLDDKRLKTFRNELLGVLARCNPKPETRFCIAIEEGEAWFLGDLNAIQTVYPKAKRGKLRSYKNDAICGTWELLADALYAGGAHKLKEQGYQIVGAEKSRWAEQICPHMDVDNNKSPSFQYFRDRLRELTA